MRERWTAVFGLFGSLIAASCGADDGDVAPGGASGRGSGGDAGALEGGSAGEAAAGEAAGGLGGVSSNAGAPSEAGAGGESGEAPLPPLLSFARVQPAGTNAIRALSGSGTDDVFAVGDEGRLFHFYERSWRLENSATSAALTGVWASGANDIYVAVDDNFVLHSLEAGKWTREPLPAGYKLTDIWGSGPSDVYALTGDGTFRSDGSGQWLFEPIEPASAPLTAVWGSSASDVFVVSAFANDATVFHTDGSGEWEQRPGPEVTLVDVSGTAGHVFAAGGNTVYSLNGDGDWTAELVLENDTVGAVFALSQSAVYACSENGSLFRSNGAGTWSEGQPVNPNGISPPCQALWASGPGDVYAGTTTGLFHGVAE
jgi:hypothetical protein